MQKKKTASPSPFAARRLPGRLIESLEPRQFLSASSIVVEPSVSLTADASSSSITGYTPAQIKAAYGFTSISLNGSTAALGTGQTIAIVDAYNDPNLASDLHTFDQAFGLSDPTLTVESQSGSTTALPATSASWAGEISLDVEWAHAIAPGANILLVEANSSSLTNLLAAVNTARNASGVSVVSMSWGSSEFMGETAYDSYFTTPSGHQGITFVSASGDDGSSYGPEWPSTSPNVLSVGGSSLSLTSSGSVSSETAWSDSGGGVSLVEGEPSYQAGAETTGRRTSPDVSYDANPSTGFAVYDSLSYEGYSGWQEFGGTSAGAPQWGALIAIADQGRVLAGKTTLDGATGTLPALYSLYASPSSSSYSSYLTYFNDVTSGSTSRSVSAQSGYDAATGLGTPHADKVVSALIAANGATTTTTITAPSRPIWRPRFFGRNALTSTALNATIDSAPSEATSTASLATSATAIALQLGSVDAISAVVAPAPPVGASTLADTFAWTSVAMPTAGTADFSDPSVLRHIDMNAPAAATVATVATVSTTNAVASASAAAIAASVRAEVQFAAEQQSFFSRGNTVANSVICLAGVFVAVAYANATAKSRRQEKTLTRWPFAMIALAGSR